MPRRLTALCLALAALTALVVPAAAPAKSKKKVKLPVITKVTPMRLKVGSKLTIRGRNFSSNRRRNTVVFRSPGGRSAFAKPFRASRTKLVLKVPASVRGLLSRRSTRFKLRVLSARKFSKWTPKRLSPVLIGIGGGPGGGPGSACVSSFDDHDLLSRSTELSVGTDPCIADTDGDALTDGWEFYAAKDLNIKAVPYPGSRPFPNALDPSDAPVDFDGDGLMAREEYRAWRATGSSFELSRLSNPSLDSALGYSDGTKFSRLGETPSVPAWRSASYGLPNPPQPFPATFNLHGDGAWRDDERDADRDGLSNWLESADGPSNTGWFKGFWANPGRFEPPVKPWKDPEANLCGYFPGFYDERPFANLDVADGDADGDNLLDGEDDQDNDDFTNITELYEVTYDLDGNGNPPFCGYPAGVMPSVGGGPAPVNGFNPCVPNPGSRTCPDYRPF